MKLPGCLIAAALMTGVLPLAMPVAAAAQGMSHSLFMRGSIVDMSGGTPTICVGRTDGAAVGQTLTVVRVSSVPGGKSGTPMFRRTDSGTVRITALVDDHFARASVVSGTPAKNDLVELRRDGSSASASRNPSGRSAMPKEMTTPGRAERMPMKENK